MDPCLTANHVLRALRCSSSTYMALTGTRTGSQGVELYSGGGEGGANSCPGRGEQQPILLLGDNHPKCRSS